MLSCGEGAAAGTSDLGVNTGSLLPVEIDSDGHCYANLSGVGCPSGRRNL